MPTPNSTVLTTLTVVNNSGVAVTNLSTVTALITFPDASSAAFSLTDGITALGGGVYDLAYNTKGIGKVIEEWSVFTTNSTPQAQFRNVYTVQEGTS